MRGYVILLVAAVAAFGGSLFGSFHFDDYSLLSNPGSIWDPLQTRPLTMWTFWINRRLGGSDPAGWHAMNLLLHTAAVMLLFHVLCRLMEERAALLGAAVFAIHPVQSEAVAYVFARGSILCTLLCLVSLNERLRGRRWAAVAWFGTALLAKEECVTFPIFLAIFLMWSRKLKREDWLPLSAMLVLAAAAGLRVLFATRLVAGSGAGFSAGVTPLDYLAVQGLSILRYMRLLVVPWGFTIAPNVSGNAWLGWLGVIALLALAWRLNAFWFLAGLVLLIPSSSVFPAADLAADHRMYLPMIAFAAGLGSIAAGWKAWIPTVAAAVLMLLSISRMAVWRTERSLWEEAVRASPGKVRPLIQLSRTAPMPEALELLTRAQALAPRDSAVSAELGSRWLRAGQKGNALVAFGRALALAPRDPNAMANRGVALMALGQSDAARHDFESALGIDPCLAAARTNLVSLGGKMPACSTAK